MARFGVSYFGVRDPRHARADLDEIAEAGFRAVTHTLSEHDLRYHEKDVGKLVEETRARGLEAALDPWGVAGVFGGEAYSELALTDLSARQIDAAGESVPACCPNAEPTRALLRRWARTAVDLGADVLFWDEPHFYLGALRTTPRASCCRCVACREKWHAAHGGELPPEGTPELADFRAETLRSLLADAIAATSASRTRHSLCLLPRGEFSSAGSDDWEGFARVAGLSRLSTDPYWMSRPVDPAEYVPPCRALRDLARPRQDGSLAAGHRIAAARRRHFAATAAVAAAQHVSFWSFRGTERMSTLACEDPDTAWRAMCEAVRRFP